MVIETKYAIRAGRNTVAHLVDGDFLPALCGRPTDFTSNVPWGRRLCKDCLRIEESTTLKIERVPNG